MYDSCYIRDSICSRIVIASRSIISIIIIIMVTLTLNLNLSSWCIFISYSFKYRRERKIKRIGRREGNWRINLFSQDKIVINHFTCHLTRPRPTFKFICWSLKFTIMMMRMMSAKNEWSLTHRNLKLVYTFNWHFFISFVFERVLGCFIIIVK